jgi:hypothetical protein
LDLYTIYRKPHQEKLKSFEEEYLEKIADQYAYFALPHYLKARNTPTKENIFEASAYSANRKLLKKYLEGKLFFTDLPSEEKEKEEKKTESSLIMSSDPQYQKPLHQLFSIVDFAQSSDTFYAKQGLLSIADSMIDHAWRLPFISSDLEIRIARYGDMATKVRAGLYQYQDSDFPEITRVEDNHPSERISEAQEEQADEKESQKAKSDSLIDQFLASPSSIKRKRMPPSESETPSVVTESITEDEDLVTETLARLHLLQNNPEEAIRIYQKLRLLFPEKSAYFDAQINKIKER